MILLWHMVLLCFDRQVFDTSHLGDYIFHAHFFFNVPKQSLLSTICARFRDAWRIVTPPQYT
jgi:hypothetical protein